MRLGKNKSCSNAVRMHLRENNETVDYFVVDGMLRCFISLSFGWFLVCKAAHHK